MKIGLVLSGGAAWGLANIGILDVLERNGFRCDCIAGSSMGAIVAGVYALGVPVSHLTDIATRLSLLDTARFADHPLADGLHSGVLRQKLEQVLVPLIGDARIGDCRIPFVCVAGRVRKPIEWQRILQPHFTDYFFASVESYTFPLETKMIDALLATSAIPVVFAPVRIGDHEYVDLVHFGAIPVRRLREMYMPDVVIATDTNPRYGRLRKLLPQPWREFLARGMEQLELDRRSCNLIIKPTMPYPVFRFDRAKEFIAAGHREAEARLPDLRQLLSME